jgi:hypothetical protein
MTSDQEESLVLRPSITGLFMLFAVTHWMVLFFSLFPGIFFLRCFRITYHMIRWFQTLNMANEIEKKTIHFMASHKLLTLLDAKDEGWMPQALMTPP